MQTSWKGLCALGAGLLVLAPGLAMADVEFRAGLTGLDEVPAISTEGRGKFAARLGASGELHFELGYTLESDVVAAHIHLGQQRTIGGVIAFLCGGGSKPACPPAPATIRGRIIADDIIGPMGQGIEPGAFREAIRAMVAGATYVNVHSTRWPGGEIRGQVRGATLRSAGPSVEPFPGTIGVIE